jgi:hypothetical protein
VSRRRIAGFSLAFIIRVTIAALIGFIALKWIVNRAPVPPGVRRAVNAA